jgi:hypothetical protein
VGSPEPAEPKSERHLVLHVIHFRTCFVVLGRTAKAPHRLAVYPHFLWAKPAQAPHTVGKALSNMRRLPVCGEIQIIAKKVARRNSGFFTDRFTFDTCENIQPWIIFTPGGLLLGSLLPKRLRKGNGLALPLRFSGLRPELVTVFGNAF